MIIGKTHHERHIAAEIWTRKFAFLPVQLADGRWIWRETYWQRHSNSDPTGGPGVSLFPWTQRVAEIPPKRDYGPPPAKR